MAPGRAMLAPPPVAATRGAALRDALNGLADVAVLRNGEQDGGSDVGRGVLDRKTATEQLDLRLGGDDLRCQDRARPHDDRSDDDAGAMDGHVHQRASEPDPSKLTAGPGTGQFWARGPDALHAGSR